MSKPRPTCGGGNYKDPVINEAKKVFGKNKFTFAEGRTLISGYTKNIQNDLIASGDLIKVHTHPGYIHYSLVSGEITFYASYPGLYRFKNEV